MKIEAFKRLSAAEAQKGLTFAAFRNILDRAGFSSFKTETVDNKVTVSRKYPQDETFLNLDAKALKQLTAALDKYPGMSIQFSLGTKGITVQAVGVPVKLTPI